MAKSWTKRGSQTTSIIRSYDLDTAQRRVVAEGGSPTTWSYAWPAVSGQHIVFEREEPLGRQPKSQIMLADLNTGHMRSLTAANVANSEPAISGDIVVWKQGWRYEEGRGITIYDARRIAYRTIRGTNIEQPKATDGRYVLYPTGSHVELYDAQTGKASILASPQPDGYAPGNMVVAGARVVIVILSKPSSSAIPLPLHLFVTMLA